MFMYLKANAISIAFLQQYIKAMFSSKNFQDSPSHRMFGHMHVALNVDEKN
jgi:hypothetical protein